MDKIVKNDNLKDLINLKPEQFLEYLKNNIKYGFKYKNKVYSNNIGKNDLYYKIKTISKTLSSKYGICWDITEVIRQYFNYKLVPNFSVFLEQSINGFGPTHTFICY